MHSNNDKNSFEGIGPDIIKSLRREYFYSGCANQNCSTSWNDQKDMTLRKCARCKHERYCSRECQKADWPEHRRNCGQSHERTDDQKLIGSLAANPHLRVYLEAMLCIELGILDDPEPSEMYRSLILYGIEPSNSKAFSKLSGASFNIIDTGNRMKGLPQIYTIFASPLPPEIEEVAEWPTDSDNREGWQVKRNALDANGRQTDPLCVVHWATLDGPAVRIATIYVIIGKYGLELARRHVAEKQPSMSIPNVFCTHGPKIFKSNFSRETIIDYINAKIRQDTFNQWLLRTPVTKNAMEVIREASSRRSSHDGALGFFADFQSNKNFRDQMYKGVSDRCKDQDEVTVNMKAGPDKITRKRKPGYPCEPDHLALHREVPFPQEIELI